MRSLISSSTTSSSRTTPTPTLARPRRQSQSNSYPSYSHSTNSTTSRAAPASAPLARPASRQSTVPTASSGLVVRRKPSAGILTTTTAANGARETRLRETRLRFPLRSRDHHATAVKAAPNPTVRPLMRSTTTPRPKMASEKRPVMPTVARGGTHNNNNNNNNHHHTNRPPLTPKIATTRTNSTPQLPPSATLVSPVPNVLSSNITPRSGSRQSRVDSANSTPSHTPVAVQDPEPKFFHARDAQRQHQQPRQPLLTQQPRQPLLTQQPAFLYANGALPDRPAVPSQPSQDNNNNNNLLGKFVYANGTRDRSPPPTLVRASTSTLLTAAKLAPGRIATTVSSPGLLPCQQPTSPVKMSSYPGAKTVGSNRSSLATSPQPGAPPATRRTSGDLQLQVRVAASLGNTLAHSRNNSLTPAEPLAAPPPTSNPFPGLSGLTTTTHTATPTAAGFASLLQAADDFAESTAGDTPRHDDDDDDDDNGNDNHDDDNDNEDEDEDAAPLQSPATTKSPTQDKELSELVASARRERKVQDLQITNASLEAINRTLERQLRKQTAELRRYRRLSRSGPVRPERAKTVSRGEGAPGCLRAMPWGWMT
ncbi:hypothetical protein P8C59_001561 [Phyllachora maydis]|uniref:Uncharacterized protein n=1 Tax=Phyllachora maydis TaxID=1825666 RepID=A0AAD9HYN0_9PEZI|nr:hypothetical protein P8C59_001561 [Phyllachora maydis]